MGYQFFLVLPLQKGACDKGECNSIRENVSASKFIRNDLKGLLLETHRISGYQLVLTACDNFSRYETEQLHKHKTPRQLKIHYVVLVGP